MFLGQEDHADAVFTWWRQRHALGRHLGTVIVVGHLDQDAGAVAHQLVGPDGAAVVQVGEDVETLTDDCVRALSFDVRDEADAASVVFGRRVVEALRQAEFAFGEGSAGGDSGWHWDRCETLLGLGQGHGSVRGAWKESWGRDYRTAAKPTTEIQWGLTPLNWSRLLAVY